MTYAEERPDELSWIPLPFMLTQRMSTDEVEVTVRRAIARRFAVSEHELRGEMVLKDDLGASSLAFVELIVELEKVLDTTIEYDADPETVSVEDVVRFAVRSLHVAQGEAENLP
jgi:acyl carrier protein